MPSRSRLLALVLVALLPSLRCKKPTGACEVTYDESSPDGSIPAGLAACLPNFTKERCDPTELRDVTLGLKTSSYDFTQDATCPELGYQDCSGGRGIIFYASCPGRGASSKATAASAAPAAEAPTRKSTKPAKMTLDAPLAVPDDAPFKGNPDGKLVLHVFVDFQDPFSKRLMSTLDELAKDQPELEVVFRHHPLAFHRQAPLAHQASIEAYAQKGNEGFWALATLLFDNHRALARPDLVGYAKRAGLDVAAFEKSLDAGTHRARLQKDVAVAEEAGMRGAPVMVFGTEVLRGALPKPTIEQVLASP